MGILENADVISLKSWKILQHEDELSPLDLQDEFQAITSLSNIHSVSAGEMWDLEARSLLNDVKRARGFIQGGSKGG